MMRNILRKDEKYNRYIAFSIVLNLIYTIKIIHEYLCLNLNLPKYNLLELTAIVKNLKFLSYILVGLILVNNIVFMGYRDKMKQVGLKLGLVLVILVSQSLIDLVIAYTLSISLLRLLIPIYISLSSLIFLDLYIKLAGILERKIISYLH